MVVVYAHELVPSRLYTMIIAISMIKCDERKLTESCTINYNDVIKAFILMHDLYDAYDHAPNNNDVQTAILGGQWTLTYAEKYITARCNSA